MTGWETLGDAIPSDANQFGGQYLNRVSQLLIGTDIAVSDTTLAPIIGTKWTFKSGKLWLQDVAGTHTINLIPDTQSVNVVIKTPAQSFTPDYMVLRTQNEELQNKTMDANKNTFLNMPTGIPADNSIGDIKIAAHTSTKITITNKGQLPSDIIYNPLSLVAVDTLKYIGGVWARHPKGTANQILAMNGTATDLTWVANAAGASNSAPNTWTAAQTYQNDDIILNNPLNTFHYTFDGGALTLNVLAKLPVLTGDDFFSFRTNPETKTNKYMAFMSNTLDGVVAPYHIRQTGCISAMPANDMVSIGYLSGPTTSGTRGTTVADTTGMYVPLTQAAASTYSGWFMTGFPLTRSVNPRFRFRIKERTQTSAARLQAGFSSAGFVNNDTHLANTTSGVFFACKTTDTNFFVYYNDGTGAMQAIDTGVSRTQAGPKNFEIIANDSIPNFTCYIDGALVATLTTRIPSTSIPIQLGIIDWCITTTSTGLNYYYATVELADSGVNLWATGLPRNP